MTKGSRSLNGLFIAFDLFQTAAVKTIMFSHGRRGGERGQTAQLAISRHQPRKMEKLHPGASLNDKRSPTSMMDHQRSLPLGGSTEQTCEQSELQGQRPPEVDYVVALEASSRTPVRKRGSGGQAQGILGAERRRGSRRRSESCSPSKRHVQTQRKNLQCRCDGGE